MQSASRLVRVLRRHYPAPSISWDPSRTKAPAIAREATIALTVRLPEDAVMEMHGRAGQSLMEVLESGDLSDVWPGGACGGACNCSTCRILIVTAPCIPEPRSEDEEYARFASNHCVAAFASHAL